jgi:hypothetical protein
VTDALQFWLHDNWLPGLMVLALAVVLLRLVLIARRGRIWRDLGKAATAAGGVAAAAAVGVAAAEPVGVAAAEPASVAESLGKSPADGGSGGTGDDGSNQT